MSIRGNDEMSPTSRYIGRFFHGVLASAGLPPDAAQDVVKVNAQRGRVAVADGAGDTGAPAGEWAHFLTICYSLATSESSEAEPDWLQRAGDVWRDAHNLRALAARGIALNRQELGVLQRGVEAAFVGAVIVDEGGLIARWVARGDCEVMLFRQDRLVDFGPLRNVSEFSSVPAGLNSRDTSDTLRTGEWRLLNGDIVVLASDALARFVLQHCMRDEIAPDAFRSLIAISHWDDLRAFVERWRGDRDEDLRNDDVAFVRIAIDEIQGSAGPFSLERDRAQRAHLLATAPFYGAGGDGARPRDQRPPIPSFASMPPAETLPLAELARVVVSSAVTTIPEARRPWRTWAMFVGGFIGGVIATALLMAPGNATHTRDVAALKPEELQRELTIFGAPSTNTAASGATEENGATSRAVSASEETTAPPIPRKTPATTAVTAEVDRSLTKEKPTPIVRESRPAAPRQRNADAAAPKPEGSVTTAPAAASPPPRVAVSPPPTAQGQNARTESPLELAATAIADAQPAASLSTMPKDDVCKLEKGTKVYLQGGRDKDPLLVVEADGATCNVIGQTEGATVIMISAWISVSSDTPEPDWILRGTLPDRMKVRTAPNGDGSSGYLGELQKGTPFRVRGRERRGAALWLELRVAGNRGESAP